MAAPHTAEQRPAAGAGRLGDGGSGRGGRGGAAAGRPCWPRQPGLGKGLPFHLGLEPLESGPTG
eukprot:7984019-Pyramimonas_sp.AAC.1